jgi:hypothetical protein
MVAIIMLSQIFASFKDGQLIARIDQDTSIEALKFEFESNGFEFDNQLVKKLNIWLIIISPEFYKSTEDGLTQLRKLSGVVYAQLDHNLSQRVEPNDPFYPQMWNLNNTGQSGGVADADIDAPEAWDITTGGVTALGDEIVVAVVDGGVSHQHVDLIDNIWVNENEIPSNGIDDDENGYIDDIVGWNAYSNNGSVPSSSHGTHVSGTIGAKGDNSDDVTGINWDVKIMCVAGSTSQTSVASIAYGYVLDQKTLWIESGGEYGANVVATNSSFGIDYADCNSGSYPVWNDLYNAMGEVGILSAAATINSNQNVDNIGDVPTGCSSDYMVSVTNTTDDDVKYSGAGYGLETIDLGAPGTHICSTIPGNNVSCSYTGTSMATPHVAGAVGLMHAAATLTWAEGYVESPALKALELKSMILDNVDILPTLEGVTVSGGRLNLYNAVYAIANAGSNFQSGDVNMDSVINILDVVNIANYIVTGEGFTQVEIELADMDGNGEINVVDIVSVINIILNINGNN